MRLRRLAAGMLLATSSLAFAGTPAEAVDSFHKALRKNDPDTVLGILAREAVIYEQGFAETSRQEWISKQLGAAIAFERDADRRVLRRESHEQGDLAWVTSLTRTTVGPGVSTQKAAAQAALTLDGAETAVLQREQGEWKIVHLHWSAHEAGPDEGHTP